MSATSVFEIYFVIHQFGNNFFLNRMSFKRKQAHLHRANGKGKKAISESTVNSQQIAIVLKLEAIKTSLSVQGQRRVLLLYSIPLYLSKQDHSHFYVFH